MITTFKICCDYSFEEKICLEKSFFEVILIHDTFDDNHNLEMKR